MFNLGDAVTTTVQMIGGRREDVTGTVVKRNMSSKTPGRVLSYVIDAAHAGYGELFVAASDARDADSCDKCGAAGVVHVGHDKCCGFDGMCDDCLNATPLHGRSA